MKKYERIVIATTFCLIGAGIVAIAMELLLLKTGHVVMATHVNGIRDLIVAAMAPVAFMLMSLLFNE